MQLFSLPKFVGSICVDEGIDVDPFVEGNMAECFPILCYCVVGDEDELRGYVLICQEISMYFRKSREGVEEGTVIECVYE